MKENALSGRPKLCPKCRKLVGANDETCYQCGANLGLRGRLMAGATRTATTAGEGMPWWRLVLIANVALFVIGIVVTMRSGAKGSLFSLLMVGPSDSVHLQLGLQVQSLVLNGDYWRLITCLFLHGGIVHLGFNMYFLAQLGPTAEQLFGNRGFLLIYFLGGLLGSLVELVLGNPVLGASGSVMALIGALAGLGMSRAGTWDNELTREMIKILLFVTVFGLIVGSVAHGAHVGGFIGGGLTLLLIQGLRRRRAQAALRGLSLGTTAMVVGSFVLMGMNLSQPSPPEDPEMSQNRQVFIKYQQCVKEGYDIVREGSKAKAPTWTCFDELRPLLEGTPARVLDGFAEVMRQPDVPGVAERFNGLVKEHNVWIRGEARRLGLVQ